MEDYINKFNTLSGATISEHQKNFNVFMKKIKNSDIDVNALLEKLQPQHPQQEIFHTRLSIEFGHRQQILNALTSGNKLIIKTVLRKADLNALFEGVTAKKFVEEVCVKLSPSTRIKLMNRLGKSDYFQSAVAAYGIADCKALLANCKVDVLKEYIENTKIRFTDRELIRIFQKHSVECLELYFKHRTNVENFSNCHKLARYLILHNIEDFVKLLKFGYPKFGRRCLKKLITSNLVDIKDLSVKLDKAKLEFKRLDSYWSWRYLALKYNLLFYLLPLQEYVGAFEKSLPDDAVQFLNNFNATINFLKKIRRAERGKILFEIFKAKYGFDIHSSLNYINPQIMELLALEDRLKFDLDNGYEEMMGIDESIPLLKGKIDATTSSDKKVPLLHKLVYTCKVNDDLIALNDLLKYFNKRHRNEDRYLRNTFLYNILYNFKHERLDEEICALISEAFNVFTINNEFFDGTFLFLEMEIYNKYFSGKDYTTELKRFIKFMGGYERWNCMINYPEIEKACIIKSHEFINVLFKGNEQQFAYLAFINTISDWNKRHRNQKISLLQFPNVIEVILSNSWYYQGSVVRKLLQCVPRNDAEKEIHQKIFEINYKHFTEELSVWLLKNRPDYLLGKANNFLHEDVCKPNFLRIIARNYTLNLHEEFVEVALEIITNPDENEKELSGAFLLLSFIPKHFKTLENFLRTTKEPLRLRKLLTKLKFNDVPENNLKIISYLIKSKYSAMISMCLNHTLHHSREEALIGFAKTCGNHQVTNLVNSKIALEIITHDGDHTKSLFKNLYRISAHNQEAWELVLKHLDTQRIPFIPQLTYLRKDRIPLLLERIFKFELDTDTTYALLRQLQPKQIDSDLLDVILKINSDDYKLKDFLYKVFLHNPKLLGRVGTEFKHSIVKFVCVKSLMETELKALALTMVELLVAQTNYNFTTSLFAKLTAHYLQNGFDDLERVLIVQLRNSVELYGNRIKFIYRSTVKSFLESLPTKSDDELWKLSEKLVRAASDKSVLSLVVEILPHSLPKHELLLEKCRSVIETIENKDFPIVGVFLNQHKDDLSLRLLFSD